MMPDIKKLPAFLENLKTKDPEIYNVFAGGRTLGFTDLNGAQQFCIFLSPDFYTPEEGERLFKYWQDFVSNAEN
jgi:hypothetical protein